MKWMASENPPPQEIQRLRISLGEVSDGCLPEASIRKRGERTQRRSLLQIQGDSIQSCEVFQLQMVPCRILERKKMKTKDAFAEARKATGQDQEPPPAKFPEQATLPGLPAETPKPVRGNQMMAHFIGPKFDRVKGEPMIGLDFSFPLTSDHEELLPKDIREGWLTVTWNLCDRYRIKSIPAHTVYITIVPDDKHDLELVGAEIRNIWLAHVQEKGAGQAKKVVRLSFRVVVERTKAIRDFVWANDGEFCWLELVETQGKLL
jgi:hypothetical protein